MSMCTEMPASVCSDRQVCHSASIHGNDCGTIPENEDLSTECRTGSSVA